MAESVGDESIYLRLDLLKKGLVQFTDATTAARLLREHDRDIRYNAAWKKSLATTLIQTPVSSTCGTGRLM
jgi:hypothetical protein